MKFTRAEFDVMLNELFCMDQPCYDTLCVIAERELSATVSAWCRDDLALVGRDVEADILQDTLTRLIKYCISRFFLREGRQTPNDDPEQFCRWIYTVAKNVKRDYSNRFRAGGYVDYDELSECIADESDDDSALEELRCVFDAVFTQRIGIHKLLAWLCVSVIILEETDSRSVATEALVDRFADATLDHMCDFFLSSIEKYPSLSPTAYTVARMRRALDERDEGGVRIGGRSFESFFMAKGGKYSVSDWIHKINLSIKRSIK